MNTTATTPSSVGGGVTTLKHLPRRPLSSSFSSSLPAASTRAVDSHRQEQQQQSIHDEVDNDDDEGSTSTADFVNNVVPKSSQKKLALTSTRKKIRVQIVKTVTIDVEPNATLRDVKSAIELKEGIPAEDQLLYFAEKALPDDLPVISSNVPRKSALVMRLRGEEFFVKTFAGTTVTLAFNPNETVGEVLAKLQSREDVKRAAADAKEGDLRLAFAGEPLEEMDWILADYGVQRDSTLFLDRAMRISVKDPYGVAEGEEDVFSLSATAASTVGEVLDSIAVDRGILRDKVKLTEDKPSQPIRGFYRVLDESKTLADCGFDEGTKFKLERLLPIRVMSIGQCVDVWSYEDVDEIYCKLVQMCPDELAGKYNTAGAFLSGWKQTKMEVLRSLEFLN